MVTLVRQEPPDIGRGNYLLYPEGLSTWISDVRISVLVLDSIVDDVARIIDTRDNLCQQFFSLFLRYRLIETLSRRSIESCDVPSRGLVINWLADDL